MVVLVKYRVLPGKSDEAITALTLLIEQVLEEPYFGSIRMLIEQNKPDNILLYEEWRDASYFNGEHKNTSHLMEFMRTSSSFLAGPPEISQWESIKVFTA